MKRGRSSSSRRAEAAEDAAPDYASSNAEPPSEPPPPPPKEDPALRRNKSLEKAKSLIARAAHENTPEEEARTTALIAARHIQKDKLLDPAPRHPILDRLEGLDDEVLDSVAGLLEDLLSDLSSKKNARGPFALMDAARWRTEARAVQQRFQLHVFALRAVLETGRIGLCDRPGYCPACGRTMILGEMVAWRRRRAEAIHYVCYVDNLSRRAF